MSQTESTERVEPLATHPRCNQRSPHLSVSYSKVPFKISFTKQVLCHFLKSLKTTILKKKSSFPIFEYESKNFMLRTLEKQFT